MTVRKAMYALFLLLTVLCCADAASPGKANVYGLGVASCGKWLATSDDLSHRLDFEGWILGWVSAAGHYNPHSDLQGSDRDAVGSWMDNYCREHPLDQISDASDALVLELAKRARKDR